MMMVITMTVVMAALVATMTSDDDGDDAVDYGGDCIVCGEIFKVATSQ